MSMVKLFVTSLILLAGILLISANSNQDKDKSLAKAQRIQGKYVFVLCEPVLEYEFVEDVNTSASQMLVGQQDIRDQIKDMVNRAIKKEQKGKIGKFDAIMTDNGDVGTLIKFVE